VTSCVKINVIMTAEMDRCSYLLILLLFDVVKLHIFVFCYDEDSMHEAIQRASHETFTEATMLSSVSEYIAGHKFFARDPRNDQVLLSMSLFVNDNTN